MPSDEPDVEIGASVRAKRLRFKKKPRGADVSFRGDADGQSTTERENLPDDVEPGVTYRDARVGWRAEACIDEELEREDQGGP